MRRSKLYAHMISFVLSLVAAAASPTAPDVNLVSIEAGAVLVEAARSDVVRTPAALIEIDPNEGRNQNGGPGPLTFVYELEQRSLVTGIDVREARDDAENKTTLEIWLSTTGPTDGFNRVATLGLRKLSNSLHVTVPKDTLARWVKVVVSGNENALNYDIIHLAVMGHPLEPSPLRAIAGTWSFENSVLRFSSDGAAISGCAVWPDRVWTVKGTLQGRAALLSWADPLDGRRGTAKLAIGDDGSLRGEHREDGNRTTSWIAIKRADPGIDCRVATDERRLRRRLDRAAPRGLVLTGVGFDTSTDELKLDSTSNELVALEKMLLDSREISHVRVLVLGRATEPPADELKRCEKRAARLAAHLRQAGIPEGTVELEVGIVRSGAVQLEPRVEVQLLPN